MIRESSSTYMPAMLLCACVLSASDGELNDVAVFGENKIPHIQVITYVHARKFFQRG